jgi:hypothetical protein
VCACLTLDFKRCLVCLVSNAYVTCIPGRLYVRCPKGALYILLDTADALCEAECADQGNSAKCIRCFGHVDVFREEYRHCSARAPNALAFEYNDDMVLSDLPSSVC